MTNQNEHLEPMYDFREREPIENTLVVRLTPVIVERTYKERRSMLALLKSEIGTQLYQALSAKVEYEETFLLDIAKADAAATEARKHPLNVLKPEYFTEKPLDTNIL